MKKYILFIFITLLLMSFMADETMTKENGAFVINTTELGKNVEGYQGPTPLKAISRTIRWRRLSSSSRLKRLNTTTV